MATAFVTSARGGTPIRRIRSRGASPAASSTHGVGGLELDQVFVGAQLLDTTQKELAVELIRRSSQVQMERIECIASGATLATEQVQDVRLDLLERGPEVAATSVFVDLFVGFLLDSSLPGKLISTFANKVCKRLVARSAILSVDGAQAWSDSKAGYKVIKTFIGSDEMYRTIDEEMNAARYLEHARFWRGLVALGSSGERQRDITAAAKTVMRARGRAFTTAPLQVDGDSPGVGLLGAVLEFVAVKRLLLQHQSDRMETFIRMGFMTCEEARKFLRLAEFDPFDSPLKEIRDRCKLLFEAIVWASLYHFDEGRKLRRTGILGTTAELTGIDGRLQDYWLNRFAGEIERWVQSMTAPTLRALGLNRITRFSQLDRLNRLGFLENYFIELLRNLPQDIEGTAAFLAQGP